MMNPYGAEFPWAFWLVLGGSAVLATTFSNVGIGLHGVAPIIGALLGAYTYRFITGDKS